MNNLHTVRTLGSPMATARHNRQSAPLRIWSAALPWNVAPLFLSPLGDVSDNPS